MAAAPEEFQPTPDFIEKLIRQDRAAVAVLAEACGGLLLDHLKKNRHRHGRPEGEWPDIMQEVLGKFLVDAPKLDRNRPLLPYLRQMALNCARDRARQAKRRTKHEMAAGHERLRTAVGASPLAHLARADAHRLIESKLQTLTESDQRVLRIFMNNTDGRHIVAIAASEGIERGAAQMRCTRALERLRKTMDTDDSVNEIAS